MSTRTTFGDQLLPTNANLVTGYNEDSAAILTALQALAARNNKIVCLSASGAPSGTVTDPTIRIRTNGDSTNSLAIKISNSSWLVYAASATL